MNTERNLSNKTDRDGFIKGKYLFDSNIHISFDDKEASINYGYPVDNETSRIPKYIYEFLYPFLVLIWLSYFFIHYYLILPYISHVKSFNQVTYLNFMNSFYRFLFGSKTAFFEGSHDSTQITICSKNNFEFDYTLTGDYSTYCSSIELYGNINDRKWHSHTFESFSGWFFVITFSKIPQSGTATITYL